MRMLDFWRDRGGDAPARIHELPANGVLRLPRGRRVVMRVATGQVVVTRAGDPHDHVLEAGAELDLTRGGRALAWALQPSRLVVRRLSGRAVVRAATLLAR